MDASGEPRPGTPIIATNADRTDDSPAPRRFGLNVKLTLALLSAALLPIAGFGLASVALSGDALAREAGRAHRDALAAVAAGIDLTLEGERVRLERAAAEPALQSLDPARFDAALATFLASQSFFREALLLAPDGRILGGRATRAVLRPAWKAGDALADRRDPLSLRLAAEWPGLSARGGILSGAIPSGRDGERFVVLAAPVGRFGDPSRPIGLLVGIGVLDGAALQAILDRLAGRPGGYVALLARDGEILARSGTGLDPRAIRIELPAGACGGRMPGTPSHDPVADAPDGIIATLDADQAGREDLLTVSPEPFLDGWVVLGVPRATAFEFAGRIRGQLFAALLLALALAGGAAALLARAVTRPLVALTEGLARFRDGDLGHRIPAEGGDEVAAAARTANALAERLQKQSLIGSIWEELS